jgi:hypothetical protein
VTVRRILLKHLKDKDEPIPSMIDVEQIVQLYLDNHEFDGLAGGNCGCGSGELIACGEDCSECEPAYLVIAKEDGEGWDKGSAIFQTGGEAKKRRVKGDTKV